MPETASAPAPHTPNTDQTEPASLVLLGAVVRAHGLKGSVVVRTDPSARDAFRIGLRVVVIPNEGDRSSTVITDLRPTSGGLRLDLEGIGDRDRAESIVGSKVCAERRDLPRPSSAQFYACDIIGSDVFDVAGEQIGVLAEIVETGANDVWVVRGKRGEWLVPAVAHAIVTVDTAAGRIVIDPEAASPPDESEHDTHE